jgi:hypothetical protein
VPVSVATALLFYWSFRSTRFTAPFCVSATILEDARYAIILV